MIIKSNLHPPRPQPRPLAGKKIVVDPGHGGNDPGAIGPSGLKEKDVNLDVSLKLRDKLVAMGAEVRMTRETDRSVAPPGSGRTAELAARVEIANSWPCDFFLSVHSNSFTRADKNGTECYHARQASTHSRVLAALTHRQMVRQLELKDNGVIPADFYVVKHTTMPSTLVETAYISNPREEALLADPAFRERVAEAVADGVADYFEVDQALRDRGIDPGEQFLLAS